MLGLVTWAAQCIPQVTPFTSCLWDATTRAQQAGTPHVKISHGIRDDMRWWIQAIAAGMGRHGTATICAQPACVDTAHADAGAEWGVGALDGTRFYGARLPDDVRARAVRKTRESSTFLELYNLLVMICVLGAGWAGAHVRAKVDNDAILRMFKKGQGKRQEESDIVREVAL